MLCNFKIWNQGHDGQTMGIRVEDATGLQRLATCCNQPDMAANWLAWRNTFKQRMLPLALRQRPTLALLTSSG